MDIYTRKSRWKIYLALTGLIILVISILYTNYLAERLADGERDKAELWVRSYEDVVNSDLDAELSLQTAIIQSNQDIPAIFVNEHGNAEYGINFGDKDQDTEFLNEEVERLKSTGPPPIPVPQIGTIFYKQSRILTLLTYFPVLQLLLLGSFVLIGYFLFSSARRSEQNQVWVGMAKETAHQLGTPISAIVGWIEHLKSSRPDDEEVQDVLIELNNDVKRLDLIADRFSKIGSDPELKKANLNEELESIRDYMQKRAPRKVEFDFPPADNVPIFGMVNQHLFAWVLENLMRNSLDSMGGKGKISAKIETTSNEVSIELSDTGKGIPQNKFKTVFQPGFTTKKRGWGLGLSLAKRIIEDYHSGRIFVKNSTVDKGTTFCIKLPLSQLK